MIKKQDRLSVWTFTPAQFVSALILLVALRLEWERSAVVIIVGERS